MTKSLAVGEVVFSLSGRDMGRFFVVTEVVDDTFVKIADGDLRRLSKAKLKKIKHLRSENAFLEKIGDKLRGKKVVHDVEIKSALKSFNG